MTPEERIQMNRIVEQMKEEKDHDKFIKLVEELNKLIEKKERHFPNKQI